MAWITIHEEMLPPEFSFRFLAYSVNRIIGYISGIEPEDPTYDFDSLVEVAGEGSADTFPQWVLLGNGLTLPIPEAEYVQLPTKDPYPEVSGTVTSLYVGLWEEDEFKVSMSFEGLDVDLQKFSDALDRSNAEETANSLYDFLVSGDDVMALSEPVTGAYYTNDPASLGPGQDILIGSELGVYMALGADDDVARGFGGSDTFFGDDGHDKLRGGDGNDTLSGGAGNDRLIGQGGDDSLSGNEGDDWLKGSAGNDTLSGDYGQDVLRGQAGNDKLFGWFGEDLLYGSHGNDSFVGGPGRDTLYGGAGDDFLSEHAYSGYHHVTGEWLSSSTSESYEPLDLPQGEFANELWGGIGYDVLIGGDNSDKLMGGKGQDSLEGWGGDDYLYGGSRSDIVYGGAGNDTVIGGLGNDTVGGGSGDDFVSAGAGNDLLRSIQGADTLIGGEGADVFRFEFRGINTPVVRDFTPGVDRIEIDTYPEPSERYPVWVEDHKRGAVLHYENHGTQRKIEVLFLNVDPEDITFEIV